MIAYFIFLTCIVYVSSREWYWPHDSHDSHQLIHDKNIVGITYNPHASRAIADHTLFMYDTIDKTSKYEPVLLLEVDSINETTKYKGKIYKTRTQWNYTNMSVAIRSTYPIDKSIRRTSKDTKVVLFNQGPSYFEIHDKMVKNKYAVQVDHKWPVDIIWTTPQ